MLKQKTLLSKQVILYLGQRFMIEYLTYISQNLKLYTF